MRETLRWIGYLIVTVVVIIALVFAAYRLRGPSRAQRDALALMQKDYRPQHGTNAFPLLWYVEYDVPDGEIAARFEREVRSEQANPTRDMRTPHTPEAKKLPEADSDPAPLCERNGSGCLAKAAANPDAMRAALAGYPVIRGRAKAFEAADYYWNDFPPDSSALLAVMPTRAQRVWLSAYALAYADGDHAGALAGTCANLGAWRRMHRGNNTLIGSMGAIASGDGAMRVFADMLATLPAGETVPDACASALRPIEAADVDRCAEMAGEFSFLHVSYMWELARTGDPAWSQAERAGTWVTFNAPQWAGWVAEQDARYCEVPPTGMLADTPRPDTVVRNTERLECISSVTACMMSDIAASAYAGYDERTLDYAAHLRLAATLLWLRDTPGAEPIAQRFEARPPALRSGQRRSGYDAKDGTLFVDNMRGALDEPFQLALATRAPAAGTDGVAAK